ncbi:MAG: hypothetical protein BroJett014_29120 [Planctomycetota bacterium]|nr:MAG: hypothetical protein BroJett014_29120 [Planctomycetota bacterium]
MKPVPDNSSEVAPQRSGRSWLSLLLVLAALLLALLVVQVAWPRHSPLARVVDQVSGPKEGPAGGAKGDKIGVPAGKPSGQGESGVQPQPSVLRPAVPEGDKAAEVDLFTIRATITRRDGSPLPGFTVWAQVNIPFELMPHEKLRALAGGHDLVTDSQGRCAVTVPRGSGVSIKPEQKGWRCEHWGQGNISTDQNIQLAAFEVIPVNVRVEYDDGLPYSGRLSTMAVGYSDRASVSDGNGSFAGIDPTLPLRVITDDERIGYGSQTKVFEPGDLRAGTTLYMVLQRSKNPDGWVEIDLSEAEPSARYQRRLFPVDSSRSRVDGSSSRPPGTVDVIKAVNPGKYELTVSSGNKIWRSQVFEVKPAEVTRLQPRFEPPAGVRVMITDEAGAPLPGAVVRLKDGAYAAFPAKQAAGRQGLADAQGQALLEGVAAGTVTLEMAAAQHEVETREVILISGEMLDLGLVRLKPARGTLAVRVENMEAGESYRVTLIHPQGLGAPLEMKDVPASGLTTFTNLPARDYMVALVETKSGAATSKLVTVDLRNAAPDVTLDCKSINRNAKVVR